MKATVFGTISDEDSGLVPIIMFAPIPRISKSKISQNSPESIVVFLKAITNQQNRRTLHLSSFTRSIHYNNHDDCCLLSKKSLLYLQQRFFMNNDSLGWTHTTGKKQKQQHRQKHQQQQYHHHVQNQAVSLRTEELPVCFSRNTTTGSFYIHDLQKLVEARITTTSSNNIDLRGCLKTQSQSEKENSNREDNMKQKQKQNKLINLSNTIEELTRIIPNLLNESIPETLLSKNVILRICPHTHTYIPVIKGRYPYFTVMKTLRLMLTNFMLNPKVKFHVTSIHVEEPSVKINDVRFFENAALQEELEKELLDKIPMFHDLSNMEKKIMYHKYSLFPWTYKIIVKWSTCSESCDHLVNDSGSVSNSNSQTAQDYNSKFGTANAKLGKYAVSNKICNEKEYEKLNFSNLNDTLNGLFVRKLNYLNKSLSPSQSSLFDNNGNNGDFERVISGIFIFELGLNNDRILVHSVEDIEIIDRKCHEEDLNNLVSVT